MAGASDIIFLPGLDGSGFYAGALAALFPAHSFRILAYPASIMDYHELALWVFEQLPAEKEYIIIAESFGGAVGIRLASMLGDRARALILSATFCDNPMPRSLMRIAYALYSSLIRKKWIVHPFNQFMCNGKNLRLAKETLHTLLATPDEVIRYRLKLVANIAMRADFHCLTLPVLVLNAASDRLVWFKTLCPAPGQIVTTVTLSGAHALSGTHPEALARCISAFIKDLT